jgi:hypothetical protein
MNSRLTPNAIRLFKAAKRELRKLLGSQAEAWEPAFSKQQLSLQSKLKNQGRLTPGDKDP